MKKYTKSIIIDILGYLHGLILYVIFFPFVAYIIKLNKYPDGVYLFTRWSVTLFIPIMVSHLLLKVVKNLYIYVASGVIVSILLLVGCRIYSTVYLVPVSFSSIPGAALMILTFLCSMATFLTRTYAKERHGQMKQDFIATTGNTNNFTLQPWEIDTFLNKPRPVHWLVFSPLYIISMITHFSYNLHILFYFLVTDVVICFLHTYLDSFHKYVRSNRSVANMPVSTMRKVHSILLITLLIGLACFILPAVLYNQEPMEKYFTTHDSGGYIFKQAPDEDNDFHIVPQEPSSEMIKMMYDKKPKEPNPIWLVMERILVILFFIIIFVLVGFVIVRALINATKNFNTGDEDEIISLDDLDDEVSYTMKKTSKEGFLSPEWRIRRKYKKLITKHTKGVPSRTSTPSELEKDCDIQSLDKTKELHDLYIKVRYSKERIQNGKQKEDKEKQ